jgi:hypothetical protein
MRGAVACLSATVLSGCEAPPPVSLVMFLDSSASFAPQRQSARQFVSDMAANLSPHEDRILAFRVASDVHWLYSNEKTSQKKLNEALDGYLTVDAADKGTAYGTALERSVIEAADASTKTKRTAVLIVGDGANERSSNGRNVDWEKLPQTFKAFPANARLYFLFIEPRAGDRFREALRPVLGDRLELFTPSASADGTAKNKILDYLHSDEREAQ